VEFIVRQYQRVDASEAETQDGDTTASTPVAELEEGAWGQELIDADILDEQTGDGQGDPPHPIERWYGLHHFVILAPAKISSVVLTESQAKILISSAQIAISNSRW
jgi:hypothetical protein